MAKVILPEFLKLALAMGVTHALSVKVSSCAAVCGRWLGGRSKHDEVLDIAFQHLGLLPERMPETPQARGYLHCPCTAKWSLRGECRLCVAYHAHNGAPPLCERLGMRAVQGSGAGEFGNQLSEAELGLVGLPQYLAHNAPATQTLVSISL